MKNNSFTDTVLTREFDENLLRKLAEHFYEDDVSDLPHVPDVYTFLVPEVSK